MPLQTRTYSDLLSLIEGLAGVSTGFTTAEQTKILGFVNRRAYQAYLASEVWPRYLAGAEARPADDNVIDFSYDAAAGVRAVSAATRAQTTVTIVCTAAVDFVEGMYVTIAGLSGTVTANGTFQVTSVSTTTLTNDTFTYEVVTTNTGTETYSGTGSVTPVTVADIAHFIRVWDAAPFNLVSAREYDFYVDSDGCHVYANNEGLSGFWVGYKKEWEGPYTTSSDIPLEFFFWCAHAAYADFLRGDGQVDKALAEENAAQAILMLELDKAEHSRNVNAVVRRIRTHNSYQGR